MSIFTIRWPCCNGVTETPWVQTQCPFCDTQRLRDAVAEWARCYTQRPVNDPGYIPAKLALAILARELGLVIP